MRATWCCSASRSAAPPPSKATGLLAIVPVAVLLWPHWRTLLLALAIAPVVFLATLPAAAHQPDRRDPLHVDEQRTLSRIGFPLEVAGHVYQHPPWWSAAWFAWEAGPLVLVATLVLAVLGFLRIERRVAWALAVATVLPMLAVTTHGRFFEHYGYTWAPTLTLLAGLGATRLRALPATAILVGAGAISVFGIATLERADYALAGDALRKTSAHSIYVAGAPTSLAGYVCPDQLLTAEELKNGATPDAVRRRSPHRCLHHVPEADRRGLRRAAVRPGHAPDASATCSRATAVELGRELLDAGPAHAEYRVPRAEPPDGGISRRHRYRPQPRRQTQQHGADDGQHAVLARPARGPRCDARSACGASPSSGAGRATPR